MARFKVEQVPIEYPKADGQKVTVGYLLGISLRNKVPHDAEILHSDMYGDDHWGYFTWRVQMTEQEELQADADDRRRAAEIEWMEREDREAGF